MAIIMQQTHFMHKLYSSLALVSLLVLASQLVRLQSQNDKLPVPQYVLPIWQWAYF